jgi:hypothetical protein
MIQRLWDTWIKARPNVIVAVKRDTPSAIVASRKLYVTIVEKGPHTLVGSAKRTTPETKRPAEGTRWVEQQSDIFHINGKPPRPYLVLVGINQKTVPMEINTGAAVSLMLSAVQRQLFPTATLQLANIKLRTYTT